MCKIQKCGIDFTLGGFGEVAMQEIDFKTITATICAPENIFSGLIAPPWIQPAEKSSGNHWDCLPSQEKKAGGGGSGGQGAGDGYAELTFLGEGHLNAFRIMFIFVVVYITWLTATLLAKYYLPFSYSWNIYTCTIRFYKSSKCLKEYRKIWVKSMRMLNLQR